MKQIIMPHLARIVSSDARLELKRLTSELARKIPGRPHILDIFLHINDPYSYLLVQTLPELEKRYNVTLRLRTIYHIDSDMFPEQVLWADNAFKDAVRLAELYDLSMPNTPPTMYKNDIVYYTNQLVEAESSPNTLSRFNTIFNEYWHNSGLKKSDSDTSDGALSHVTLKQNETLLNQLGHYMGGMLHYQGEWYWGIDRLEHFEQRANKMGLAKSPKHEIYYNRTHANFCKQSIATKSAAPTPSSLTLFFSIRSPYSHLGLERAVALAKHYNLELIIKPILPMMMRGLSVPNAKKMYIFHDTKREAKKYGIDYGYVADPLGSGVERCYALFKYAESEGKGVEYLLAYARAVNAQGIRSETDGGLKKILSACDLDWNTAKPLLTDSGWRLWAEQNLKDMYSLGLWGVPSFQYKNTAVWGQDRIFVIEKQIINDICY